jgi:hypothetical protein
LRRFEEVATQFLGGFVQDAQLEQQGYDNER